METNSLNSPIFRAYVISNVKSALNMQNLPHTNKKIVPVLIASSKYGITENFKLGFNPLNLPFVIDLLNVRFNDLNFSCSNETSGFAGIYIS